MSTREDIAHLEWQLEDAKSEYLRAHKWEATFTDPGNETVWSRDFTKDEAERANGALSRHQGKVQVDADLAIRLTMQALDLASERGEYEPDAESGE